jgi:hypothetical protein
VSDICRLSRKRAIRFPMAASIRMPPSFCHALQ